MPGPANSLNITEAGFQSFDGVSVFHGRTLTAGTGITISNGDGISGNPVIASTASTTDLHAPRFIVSNTDLSHGANFSTIAAAITAAAALGGNQTVFIQPGTYTENLTLQPNINLCAFQCDAYANGANSSNVIILGKCTATFAGNCSISGICLKTNSDFCLSVTGSSATLVNLKGCFIYANNNNAIQLTSSSASSKIQFYDCKGDIATTGIAYFTHSGAGAIKFWNGTFENNGASTTASTTSGTGSVSYYNLFIDNSLTTSSTSRFTISLTEFHGVITHNSTSIGDSISNSIIDGGSSTVLALGAGSSVNLTNCQVHSNTTNAISGSGTVSYSNVSFSSSSLNAATGQIPFAISNDAVVIKSPGAYPYTTVPQDGLILVDTSSARTIVPLASPTTGQRHIIKDSVGSAASNNITVTPSGKNIDGAASYTMNLAYGSITIIYNGTEWSIV